MAGVSTKEIKNRIRSMESTKQITKAMEMVAASKLRRAQAQVLNSRPYFEILSGTIADITATNQELSSPYLISRETGKVLCIVIGGDRGLAGGYNSNVLKGYFHWRLLFHLQAGLQVLPFRYLPQCVRGIHQF